MTDQVRKLTKRAIPATLLGSAQKDDVMTQVKEGCFRLVYSTPESFYDRITKSPREAFLSMAKQNKLTLIALDEAHLISSWQCFR